MTTLDLESKAQHTDSDDPIRVDHFIRGKVITGGAVHYHSRDLGVEFATPEILLDELVTPRSELPPLLDVPTGEIIDFLVACGDRLVLEDNVYLQEALEHIVATNPLPRRVVENLFRVARNRLTKEALWCSVESSFANPLALDGWVERVDFAGQHGALRAFPSRMIHMMAGNSPTGCISSIADGALVKAINVFKMPSSDPFTCVAMLRTMAEVDPDHPVVRSMSAVYWRGGDERIERTLYRPQYFDKIVAWGGGDAINNVDQVPRPGAAARLLRPQDFDLHDRAGGLRVRRRDRGDSGSRRHGRLRVQSGGLPRQPFHLRRRRAGRHREVLRQAAGASRCRSADRLRGRTPAARRHPRGDHDAAGDGRRLPWSGASPTDVASCSSRQIRWSSTRAARPQTSCT